jgi:hypothetical protein
MFSAWFSAIPPDVVESSASPALSPDLKSYSPDLAPDVVLLASPVLGPDVVQSGILKQIKLSLLILQRSN